MVRSFSCRRGSAALPAPGQPVLPVPPWTLNTSHAGCSLGEARSWSCRPFTWTHFALASDCPWSLFSAFLALFVLFFFCLKLLLLFHSRELSALFRKLRACSWLSPEPLAWHQCFQRGLTYCRCCCCDERAVGGSSNDRSYVLLTVAYNKRLPRPRDLTGQLGTC